MGQLTRKGVFCSEHTYFIAGSIVLVILLSPGYHHNRNQLLPFAVSPRMVTSA